MFRGAHSRRWLVASSLLAVLVIGGCSGNDSSTGPPGGGGGGTKELNSGDLAHNGVYAHTFPMTAVTYNYHCIHHGGMTASVIVQAGGAAAAAVDINDNAFSVAAATIGPGGTVTWTNKGNSLHTVTSN